MGEELIKKPDNVDSFKEWILKEFRVEFGPKFVTNYEKNIGKLQKELKNSPFWLNVSKEIPEINDRYRANNHGLSLFSDIKTPDILKKNQKTL